MFHYFAALLSGAVSGVVLGLTGGGGSILGVPLLVYVVGENVHLAIGTSLVAVGVTSLFASVSYMRQSLVKFKMALLMASPGVLSTYLGALVNKSVNGPVLLMLFAVLMMYIGYSMLVGRRVEGVRSSRVNYLKILALGFLTGFASGFFGIGGGFLLVPALFFGASLDMKESVATSLFIIFIFGCLGLLSYELQGRRIDYTVGSLFVLGGAIGGYVGAFVGKRTNQSRLRVLFALLIIVVGVVMLFSNLVKTV